MSNRPGVEFESTQSPGTNSLLADEGTPVTATPLPSDQSSIITRGETIIAPTDTGKQAERTQHKPIPVSVDSLEGSLLGDLSADLLGLETESWSLAVSPEFWRQLDRYTIKRQDVIYGETII